MIIGNGFDLAHGLQTSYLNFRESLEQIQKRLMIDKALSHTKMEELCKKIQQLGIQLKISKSDIMEAIDCDDVDGFKNDNYSTFLNELYGKLYSSEFLEERGFNVTDEKEIDNDTIQDIIREFEAIISEIDSVVYYYKRIEDICVTDNIPYDEMDEIDKIEFILKTFEDIEYYMKKRKKMHGHALRSHVE